MWGIYYDILSNGPPKPQLHIYSITGVSCSLETNFGGHATTWTAWWVQPLWKKMFVIEDHHLKYAWMIFFRSVFGSQKKTLLLVMVTFASMDIYGKKTRGLYKLKLPIQDWGWNCYRLKKEKHSRHWCGRLLFIVRDWVPSESPNFIVLQASQNWRENKQETTHFLIETCWQFHHVSSKPMKIKKPGPSIWKCMLVKTNDRIIPQKKPATSVVTPIILGCHSRRH